MTLPESRARPAQLPDSAGRVPPPRDEADLLARARGLTGFSVDAIATRFGMTVAGHASRTKGKVGVLLEQALGASGGSQATWDFPSLRIELKTIPVDSRGFPRESTFVCVAPIVDADRAEWASSWVRAKLARVLWVPIEVGPGRQATPGAIRRIGEPLLWSPTSEQERGLADDFEEIVGQIGAGGIEGVSGRLGRWLQMRPKAAHGRVRTFAIGGDGETVAVVPRGFYLRARFTGAILREPAALP
jgi:DNA mismatch repair protein MutH